MIGQAPGGVALVAGPWRRRVLVGACSLVGVLLALVTLGDVVSGARPPSDDLVALWLIGEAGAAVAAAPLLSALLERRSVGAGLALAALSAFSAAQPAALLAVALLVSLRSWRTGAAVVVAFSASTATGVLILMPREAASLLGVLAGIVVVLVLLGLVLGSRRELAERARRERELVLERARSQERARIAGEMHDSLSHHLSLIALHSGAVGRREDLSAETVRSSSRLVAELARTAHGELREVLGILHRAEPPTTEPPPGASSLPLVVEQHRTAGAPVRAELDPAVVDDPDGRLSEATSRLLHRVVRELLANAARHAPGTTVDLVVKARGERVEVCCRNATTATAGTRSAGTGLGLEGIAERVRLAGGEYEVDAQDGEFAVRVSVPW